MRRLGGTPQKGQIFLSAPKFYSKKLLKAFLAGFERRDFSALRFAPHQKSGQNSEKASSNPEDGYA